MARFRSVLGLFRAFANLSWRDLQSLRSIGGQNFFLFLVLIALQPESAEFFFVLLVLAMLFPLSSDPMAELPMERYATWPILRWEWLCIRAGSFFLNPVVWLATLLLLGGSWRISVPLLATGVILQLAKHLIRWSPRIPLTKWLSALPSPPGFTGAIMRLHWREMFKTLDPYVALTIVACTGMFKLSGLQLDPGRTSHSFVDNRPGPEYGYTSVAGP